MKLTEEQKKLVEDNHNLIYFVLRRFNWNIMRYYDIAAYALCRAAMSYNPNNEIKFSTYAVKSIVYNIWRERKKEKSYANKYHAVSLDQIVRGNNTSETFAESYLNNLSDNGNCIEQCYTDIYLDDVFARINEKDRTVLRLKLLNYSGLEIAKLLNVSHQSIYARLKRIKRVLMS